MLIYNPKILHTSNPPSTPQSKLSHRRIPPRINHSINLQPKLPRRNRNYISALVNLPHVIPFSFLTCIAPKSLQPLPRQRNGCFTFHQHHRTATIHTPLLQLSGSVSKQWILLRNTIEITSMNWTIYRSFFRTIPISVTPLPHFGPPHKQIINKKKVALEGLRFNASYSGTIEAQLRLSTHPI